MEHAVLAEKAGFETLWLSDHFHPWSHSEAHESHTWVLIGAAAARTNKIRFGTAVTCPLFRYHPAITAQAFASLRAMFPDRIFLGVGTGEAMNEVPVGYEWPSIKERIERLDESVQIMKLLWSKNFVNFKGKYYTLHKANLYDKPETQVPLYVAGFGPKVARIAGKYADGFLTTMVDPDKLNNELLAAVAEGAKEKGRTLPKLRKSSNWAFPTMKTTRRLSGNSISGAQHSSRSCSSFRSTTHARLKRWERWFRMKPSQRHTLYPPNLTTY